MQPCHGGALSAPGAAGGAWDRGVAAHRGARGAAAPAASADDPAGVRAVRVAARGPAADRLRLQAGGDRGTELQGARLRRHAGVLAPPVRGRLPGRDAALLDGRDGSRLPPLRRGAAHGAHGQPDGAGGGAEERKPPSGVQRAASGVRPLLGVRAAGVPSVPGADQGQGRAQRGLRQAQRAGGSAVRELGRARPPSAGLARRRGRSPHPRLHGGDAARAVRAGAAAAGPGGRPAAVRLAQGAGAQGVPGLRGGAGHEPVLGAVAPGGRGGARERHRREGARVPRVGAGRRARPRVRRPSSPRRRQEPLRGPGAARPAPGAGARREECQEFRV